MKFPVMDKTVILSLALLITVCILTLTGKIAGSDAMLLLSAMTGYILRETSAVNRDLREHINGNGNKKEDK